MFAICVPMCLSADVSAIVMMIDCRRLVAVDTSQLLSREEDCQIFRQKKIYEVNYFLPILQSDGKESIGLDTLSSVRKERENK